VSGSERDGVRAGGKEVEGERDTLTRATQHAHGVERAPTGGPSQRAHPCACGLTRPATLAVPNSLTNSHSPTHSLTHPLIHTRTHALTHFLRHWLIPSLTHLLVVVVLQRQARVGLGEFQRVAEVVCARAHLHCLGWRPGRSSASLGDAGSNRLEGALNGGWVGVPWWVRGWAGKNVQKRPIG
jgi:hypothetical protein